VTRAIFDLVKGRGAFDLLPRLPDADAVAMWLPVPPRAASTACCSPPRSRRARNSRKRRHGLVIVSANLNQD